VIDGRLVMMLLTDKSLIGGFAAEIVNGHMEADALRPWLSRRDPGGRHAPAAAPLRRSL
jgi:hypothetical protein